MKHEYNSLTELEVDGCKRPLKRDTNALQFAWVRIISEPPASNRFVSRVQNFTIRKYLIPAANFLRA